MKTFIVLLLVLNFTTAFAGNGVVTGDGHPVDLTKQERIDSTTVDLEFENLVSKVAMFNPAISHLLNVGSRAIKNKKINLIKIQETSHDHFTFIEDAKVKNDNYFFYLASVPTIYFYENYFTQDKDKKLKILVHEFLHMYLGTSELKVQRVTDAILKLSKGDFTEAEYKNLLLELSAPLSMVSIFDRDKNFLCDRDIGLPYIHVDKFEVNPKQQYVQNSYILLPFSESIENFNSYSEYAQSLFKTNAALIFSQTKIINNYYNKVECTTNNSKNFNLNVIEFKDFVKNILFTARYIKNYVETTEEQLKEVKDYKPTVNDVSFSLSFSKGKFSRKYNVSVSASAGEVVMEKPLLATIKIDLSKFEYFENLAIVYKNYKNLYSILGTGPETSLPLFTQRKYVTEIGLNILPGKVSAKDAYVSCWSCNIDEIKEPAKNGSIQVTSNEIIYHANVLKTDNTTSKYTTVYPRAVIATVIMEFIE